MSTDLAVLSADEFKEYSVKIMAESAKESTKNELGDRSSYIGASDIGGCLRKAYCSKMYTGIEFPLETHIRFERGHIAERIVAKMLSKLGPIAQYETQGMLDDFMLKAHVDFLVKGEKEWIYVECKTVSGPIKEIYPEWRLQCQFGMGLVMANNPGVKVRCLIIAMDVDTGWLRAFDLEPNAIEFEVALLRAGTLITALKTGNEPKAEQENYCSSCLFKSSCPGLMYGKKADLPASLNKAAHIIKRYKSHEKVIKRMTDMIKEFMVTANLNTGVADTLIVQCRDMKGKTTFNKDLFEEFLNKEHPEMSYTDFTTTGEATKTLSIK